MPNPALRADLLMLLTAMIWGSSFVAQRLGMDSVGPFLYSGLRFALAVIVLLPVIYLLRRRSAKAPAAISQPLVLSGILMGVVLALGINLQQVGLLFTSVTNSGFITGLYVIVVPLLSLALGHKAGPGIWLGALLAVLGMLLLSVGAHFQLALGDGLQLIGAFIWGLHVLIVSLFASRHDTLLLAIIQLLTCALISLLLALLFEDVHNISISQALPAILYGGILGVAVGFTLQVVAQKHAIASHAAIIFSLEAVFAALFGALLLDESLTAQGYIGCALMFAGMLLAQLWRKAPSATQMC